jgi:hypothetical protein
MDPIENCTPQLRCTSVRQRVGDVQQSVARTNVDNCQRFEWRRECGVVSIEVPAVTMVEAVVFSSHSPSVVGDEKRRTQYQRAV